MKATVDQEKARAKLQSQHAMLAGITAKDMETKWEPDHFGPSVDSILTTRYELGESGI